MFNYFKECQFKWVNRNVSSLPDTHIESRITIVTIFTIRSGKSAAREIFTIERTTQFGHMALYLLCALLTWSGLWYCRRWSSFFKLATYFLSYLSCVFIPISILFKLLKATSNMYIPGSCFIVTTVCANAISIDTAHSTLVCKHPLCLMWT